LESAKRDKPPINRKNPVSAEMIKTIVDNYAKADANLMQLRIACMCILGFTGFLRFDELINVVPAHLELSSSHLKIFIPRAKNDVYRDGNSVYINRIIVNIAQYEF
jgi:hypothetical protein